MTAPTPLLPVSNADTRAFWEGCSRHELRFQRCNRCLHVRWPPSVVCPECHSTDGGWIVSRGTGTIYSFVVYHTAFHKTLRGRVPYVTAVVALSEGPRILTSLVGCNPSQVRCDMPVRVAWESLDAQWTLPLFTPAAG